MPLSILFSRALTGVRATPVTVEVHLAGGLPNFNIVGLPDTEVREARERVRAAIVNARFEFPARRITVNLAPADLPKEGGRYDLPIALGILAASGQIDNRQMRGLEFAGELSLDGKLRDCGGALPITLAARADEREVILPTADAAIGALANGAVVYAAANLPQVCAHLCGREKLPRAQAAPITKDDESDPCISAVKRQDKAKRALAVAAAGGHSVLMVGPPGSGKSMMASCFNGMMPHLTEAEAIETAAVHSLGGKSFNPEKWRKRPYRAPHHSASAAALVGGGSRPRPGEISLAHNGVLFLDELPEFERNVLEVLREPLESGSITISRAARQADFPAAFQLIAAMNPCPCGYLGHSNGKCRCTPHQVERYRGRISGPILDRIDMHLEVSALSEKELTEKPPGGQSSKQVREQSAAARQFQYQRQNTLNARLSPGEVDRYCIPDEEAQQYIKRAISRLSLSARAYHRILRIARTIADLAQAEDIGAAHAGEAIQYRRPIFASSRA